MFDFWKFYTELSERTSIFDDYWDKFPKGMMFQFKSETLSLLQQNFKDKNSIGLQNTLAVILHDGADKDYTDVLLSLLDKRWHISEEDIVQVLELIKDPKSVEKLYQVAVHVPEYDDMRALAKKCMWALSAIKTSESIKKLEQLEASMDSIISENAKFQLEQVLKL